MFAQIYAISALALFLFLFSIWKHNNAANVFLKCTMLVATCASVVNVIRVFSV